MVSPWRCVVQLQVAQRSNTIPINSDYKRPKSRVVEVAPSTLCQSLFFEDGQSGNLTPSVALEKHDITSAGFGWPSLILFATGPTNSAFKPSNLGQGKIFHISLCGLPQRIPSPRFPKYHELPKLPSVLQKCSKNQLPSGPSDWVRAANHGSKG